MTLATEHEIEFMRLRRMIADRNDFITNKGLWKEFMEWRPNDERENPGAIRVMAKNAYKYLWK